MMTSLRALLSESLDYAGLFPPARLPLEQALANYLRYRTGSQAWMLGHFVCPAARLAQLQSLLEIAPAAANPPCRIAVLAGGSQPSRTGWQEQWESDLQALDAFLQGHAGQAEIPLLEVRLPDELVQQPATALRQWFENLASHLPIAGLAHCRVYCELPLAEEGWAEQVAGLVEVLAQYNRRASSARGLCSAGFKLRTGGSERAAFPSPWQLARAILACRDAQVSWKATAGLHHPLRHFDPAAKAWSHGFLNVLAAAVLAWLHDLSDEQVQSLLVEQTATPFAFQDDVFRWGDLSATSQQIAAVRPRTLVSFGSCSFDEPLQDLRTLGLI